jgi:NAD-dependent DNA ligase
LHTVADIFVLLTVENKQILRGLPGVAEKKIALLEKEITQATQLPLRRVINALGIRHIGEVSSRDLSARYLEIHSSSARNIEDFIRFCLQEDQLQMIHGF